MRIIALDIHRTFAQVVILEQGQLRQAGRVHLSHDKLLTFARTLTPEDEVVLEATGNSLAVARTLQPFVRRVIIANPLQVRAIAHAHVKTDKIDGAVLARIHACGFLPEVWIPDERTEALRRQVTRRTQIVRHRTRLKNTIHAILHAHLIPSCPSADLFGHKGRAWLAEQPLPADEQATIKRHLRELDRLAEDLAALDRQLAEVALADAQVGRLMTISGIDMPVAIGVMAAVGEIGRFASPRQLVSYFGLNPRVRQSGSAPARHGRISKRGRAQARAMLVEAAWAAARAPGPLRAFFLRIRARRGPAIAAVATARKLAVLIWHVLTKQADYLWARPALQAAKQRALQLRAGQPTQKGRRRGAAYAYNLKTIRDQERRAVEQAERAYERLVANWRPRRPPAAS